MLFFANVITAQADTIIAAITIRYTHQLIPACGMFEIILFTVVLVTILLAGVCVAASTTVTVNSLLVITALLLFKSINLYPY